jgi:hypothetical protein
LNINDNNGCKQKLKDIANHSHFIDIRVRYDGQYYWFDGDWLKDVLSNIEFKNIDGDTCKLEHHIQKSD